MQLEIHKFFSQNLVLLVHSNLTADSTLKYENVFNIMYCIKMNYSSKHKMIKSGCVLMVVMLNDCN